MEEVKRVEFPSNTLNGDISVDIVIPVYNEEHSLERCIARLRDFLQRSFPYKWNITVVNNGSTDSTLSKAEKLSQQYVNVNYIHLDQKGRGRALRRAWLESKGDIVCYMDVDLSTDLKDLPELIGWLVNGYDLAIGSRLMEGAKVKRCLKREIISRVYNFFLKAILSVRFSDAQCGFKGGWAKAIRELLPLVKDENWFFDTELLVLAEKKGYKIREIPVTWIEDPDSRVKIIRTALEDLKGILRLKYYLLKEGL